MEKINKYSYRFDDDVMTMSYENVISEMTKLKGKARVGVRNIKSQRYFDMVERLKKKSQQKVDVVQKLLPSVPEQVPRRSQV